MFEKQKPNKVLWSQSDFQETHEHVSARLQISMLEIYNDSLIDLLTKSAGAALDIRVQGKSVSVPGLIRIQVQTEADILGVMETGEKNRKIASTKMNTQRCCSDDHTGGKLGHFFTVHGVKIFFLLSSRSHLVVALEVEGSDQVSGLTSRGTLTLCDLAGSERISKTEAEGQRLVEAAAINKSLTALGQVRLTCFNTAPPPGTNTNHLFQYKTLIDGEI